MTTKQIEVIRTRHLAIEEMDQNTVIDYRETLRLAHRDRGELLAYIDSLGEQLMTKTVTNEQIAHLLDALDHEPIMAKDYGIVRRWLEMVLPDEPKEDVNEPTESQLAASDRMHGRDTL